MSSARSLLLTLTVSCGIANGAALVPLPTPNSAFPVAGLEVNQGQANSEILFLSRNSNLAVAAQSIVFSPLGVRQVFVSSNPDPAVSFLDSLPGVVNSLTGPDPQQWINGIPRYGAARLTAVYPGIDALYETESDGQLILKLLLQPGADLNSIVFEVLEAIQIATLDEGLVVRLGSPRIGPSLFYPAPAASQQAASGSVSRQASFEVLSMTRFGLRVDDRDVTLPLQIEIKFGNPVLLSDSRPFYAADDEGNMFVALSLPEGAGKDDPFPADIWAGCGQSIGSPIPCSDVAIHKFSSTGELLFVSYLAGSTRDEVSFLGFTPQGALIVTGATDSTDFPVTAGSLQTLYAGPPAEFSSSTSSSVGGDFFAAQIDPATGTLQASTYFGGPNADHAGETAVGADGSVYFLPKWLVPSTAAMPVTRGALQEECPDESCANGYAARISASLDRLLYGTYLPGRVQASAKLHPDGSVSYAGTAEGGFPVTPGAYQMQPAGKEDGIVARLDASGTKLLFATYIGGPETDWILRMAAAPDGSVWVALSSFVQCCVDIEYRLVRLDANGERILADRPIDVGDVAVDNEGNLHAIAAGTFEIGPDAFLAHPCGLTYIKLDLEGNQIFATYLPTGSGSDFHGSSGRGLPILRIGDGRFEVVEDQPMGVYAGCLVDAANFTSYNDLSPGQIVTLFGSGMGPVDGVGFQLENGRIPTTLGGTRVLVDGQAVPVLYSSYWQVNAILPYSLRVGTFPKIQVESGGEAGNEFAPSMVRRAGITLFLLDDSPDQPAAALNEDGSLNTPQNPARKGSAVMLFGTGGGATAPPSTAGEVTPLELRPLEFGAAVWISNQLKLTVEYAGAAPGLVAGVTQINIRLPDEIPQVEGYPPGLVPLAVETPGISHYPRIVTIAVEP